MTEAAATKKRVIVSLHDVAPPLEDEIRAQVEALQRVGVKRVVLKLVPSWQGRFPISGDPGFTAWIRDLQTDGCQLVMHGFEHLVRQPLRGSPVRLLRARLFAPESAEFMGLNGTEALAALRAGLDELERAGLGRPDTFCAPGWLLTDEAENAVAEAGFRWLTGMMSVLDLPGNRLHWVPAFGFMGGGRLHELGISTLSALERASVSRSSAVKAFLHPDPSGRRRWMGTVREVERLLGRGHQPATFAGVDWTAKPTERS